jgi:hypothetical protein
MTAGHGEAPPRATRAPGSRVALIFVAGLLAIFVLAFIVGSVLEPDAPPSRCPPEQTYCADPPPGGPIDDPGEADLPTDGGTAPQPGSVAIPTPRPPSGAARLTLGQEWRGDLGIGLEFSNAQMDWTIERSDQRDIVLVADDRGVALLLESAPASELSPQQILERRLQLVRQQYPDLTLDTNPHYAILGAHIGFRDAALAASYRGTYVGASGVPSSPAGISVVVATDGRTTVLVYLWVMNPDDRVNDETRQYLARGAVDSILKTFEWGATP